MWGLRICDARKVAGIAWTDYPAFLTLARIPMLAIDDMGIEPLEVMEYGNMVSPIVELLTRRYDEQLFTIMTTNLTPDGICKAEEQLLSRHLEKQKELWRTSLSEQRHNLESNKGIWLSKSAFHTLLWVFLLPICYTIISIGYFLSVLFG